MAKDNFRRYIWLIDTIRSAGHITRKEIESKWKRSALNEYGEPLSERTFHNHKNAISEIFGIEIKHERGLGFYIDDDVEGNSVKEWMLDSLSLNNLLNEGMALRGRVLIESVPSSHKWMTDIMQAMKEDKTIEITYQSFNKPSAYTFEAHPYCLKLFRKRWYMLAKRDEYENPRIYALDRVQDIKITEKPLKMPDKFNAEKFFDNYFGVILDRDKVETVELKIKASDAKYIETLPLHNSQRIVKNSEEYTIFRYDIIPTFDFKQEILSRGLAAEVLSPEWFRKEVIDDIKGMSSIYALNQ